MSTVLLDAEGMRRTLQRMAHEIIEANQGAEDVVCVGILRRGYPLAKRLAFAITQIEAVTIPCGKLDTSGTRDDRSSSKADASQIPFEIQGKSVILVDEVLHTGRTIRAALAALLKFGRPGRVQLAVLVDRGGRQLPIQPDFVGKTLAVPPSEHVLVKFSDIDGEDLVILEPKEATSA